MEARAVAVKMMNEDGGDHSSHALLNHEITVVRAVRTYFIERFSFCENLAGQSGCGWGRVCTPMLILHNKFAGTEFYGANAIDGIL